MASVCPLDCSPGIFYTDIFHTVYISSLYFYISQYILADHISSLAANMSPDNWTYTGCQLFPYLSFCPQQNSPISQTRWSATLIPFTLTNTFCLLLLEYFRGLKLIIFWPQNFWRLLKKKGFFSQNVLPRWWWRDQTKPHPVFVKTLRQIWVQLRCLEKEREMFCA